MNHLAVISMVAVYVMLFPCADCGVQVTFSCNGNDEDVKMDDDITALRDNITALQDDVKQLQEIVTRLKTRLALQPRSGMTWSIGKLFCEDMNMILCSRDEIFPFSNNQTIPYAIGILSGDQYAPIRDATNDWVELAADQGRLNPGDTHNAAYGPPVWGRTFIRPDLKQNVFCCIEEYE